ncbi:MAG: histidine kinase [Bacteroidetes bacterium]|nr:histidine kinase [Bacteroidota bacterium]HET6243339.1 histidine kinase [Bacteroidia bacterium]
MNKQKIYWICQVSGWFLFVLLNSFFIQLEQELSSQIITGLVVSFFIGISTSHVYRNFIIRSGWLKYGFIKLIPRFIISSLILSLVYYLLYFSIISFLYEPTLSVPKLAGLFADILNIAFVYFVWSLIYFLFNFIENYKKEEIKNLKWEASTKEIELNRLKSQLNPHFMFNAMNSIRALVDENPQKAKNAITQLSNILRNTLQMGRKRLISFDEELSLVRDYLGLEFTRYEERLNVEYKLDPLSIQFKVPPLMIQTIVENAIKHGIAKLIKGGKIEIQTAVKGDFLFITVINDGKLKEEINQEKGFGIKNTIERLSLLYGNNATFNIRGLNENKVITEIKIPKYYESTDN